MNKTIKSQLIPMAVEKSGSRERGYDIYSRQLKDRIVMHEYEVHILDLCHSFTVTIKTDRTPQARQIAEAQYSTAATINVRRMFPIGRMKAAADTGTVRTGKFFPAAEYRV